MRFINAVNFMSIIMAVFFIGCSTVQTNWVDESGTPIANPHYVMKPVGTNMRVTFFYAACTAVKDLDGSTIPVVEFLDMTKKYDFTEGEHTGLYVAIQVINPDKLEYEMYEKSDLNIKYSNSTIDMQKGGKRNASNLPYRQFVYNLPFSEEIVDVDHQIILRVDNEPVLMIGNFRYHIIH